MTQFRIVVFLILLIIAGCSAPVKFLHGRSPVNSRVAEMMSGRIPCTEPFKFVISRNTRRESLILYTDCENTRMTVILLSPMGDVRAKLLVFENGVKLTEARGELSRLHPEDLLFIALFPGLYESGETKAMTAVNSAGACDYNFSLDEVQVSITLPECTAQE